MTDRIDILVSARNQTSGVFNQIKQEMSGLNSAAAALGGGLSGIGAIAGIGAVVVGLQQVGAAIDEVARRGAIFDQLGSVLDDYAASAGQVGQSFVEAGRKASAGTIGDYDLILNANRALQFEVAATSDQYAKLIELSTALGRAQGISDTQALEYLTTGIARESRLILDNLGLIIDLDEATSEYAATLGKAAGDLTQAERKQALLNAAYEQGAVAIAANKDASNSAATNFERMDAAIQNAKDNLGALFAPAVAAIAQSIANAAVAATEGMQGMAAGFDMQAATNGLEIARAKVESLKNEIATIQEILAKGISLDTGQPLAPEQRSNLESGLNANRVELRNVTRELTQAELEYFAALRVVYPAQTKSAEATLQEVDAAVMATDAQLKNAEAVAAAQSPYDGLSIATNSLAREQGVLNAALEGAPGWLRQMASEAVAAGGSILQVADDVRILKGEIDRLEGAKSGIRNAVIRAAVGVSDIVGDSRAMVLANQQIGEMNFAIGALEQRLKDGTLSQVEFDYELARLQDGATGTFDAIQEADRAAKAFAREGLSAATKAANEAEQAFNSLQSKVAGVLSESLNLDVGVNLDDILPREDAINEDARRLADVAVKGFDSPWYDYFKNNFPALFQEFFAGAADANGVKMQAAQLLKNFQDGLEPELLDKDKAKDRVRRMLLGEQSMAQLAQEIASELSAEFGGSISLGKIQATASAALGVDGGNQVQLAQTLTGVANESTGQAAVIGSNIRTGIVSALDGIGETVAIALDKQFRAENNLKVVTEAGRVNGEAWGSGFLTAMDSLTNQVLEKLAGLVVPYVEAAQARTATLNGAN